MSTPPVDPWSGQPEQRPPYGSHPPRQGGHSAPPPPGDWPPGHHPGARRGHDGWPTEPQPGARPAPGGWPTEPQPAPRPADPYPTQYGGYPSQDDATQVYGAFPTRGQESYPSPAQSSYPPPGTGGYPSPGSGYPPGQHGGQPYSSQPYSSQPGGGEPYGSQPYSGQPYSGQPYGGEPYGDPALSPPAKKSRLGLILTLGIVGLLVLCLGGGSLAYVALSGDDDADPVAGATPSAGATAAGSPSAEPSPDPRIRVVTPKTVNGRAKSTDAELRKLAEDMVKGIRSTVRNETGAIGGFYGSPAKRNMAMVVAASGFVLDPEKELDDAVGELSRELAVTKMSRISPGPLGGQARCGDGESAGISLGVCVWADQGSVGMIVLFFSSARKAKAEFATIRSQIEKKS